MHTTDKPLVVALRALAVSMLIAFGFAACSSGSDTTTADDTSTETEAEDTASEDMTEETTADEAEASTAAGGDGFELLDAGAEPRQILELTPGDGFATEETIATTRVITVQVGDGEPEAEDPYSFTLESRSEAVSTDGAETWTVNRESLGGSADIDDPTAAAQLQAELESQRGQVVTYELAKDASTKNLEGQPGNSNTTAMPPFPSEPVGVGARWQTVSSVQWQGGLPATRTMTSTLESIEGSVATIRLDVTLEAQPGENAGGVESMQGVVSATLRVDLAAATTNAESTMTTTIVANNAGQSTTQVVEDTQSVSQTAK